MRVAVTGAHGFLGWHLQCALLAAGGYDIVPLGRAEFSKADGLAALVRDCDAVVHLAGVNRGTPDEVDSGNRWLATTLGGALAGSRVRAVVHGNSIHAGSDSPFGESKAFAAETLARAANHVGAAFTDVVLPNIFGEGGRPHYNSVVATFCHEVAAGNRPSLVDDKALPLLHAQDAADVMIGAMDAPSEGVVRPEGQPVLVSEVLRQLEDMASYRLTGEFPDLSTDFRVALFNTFQSFCFPDAFPLQRETHTDARGSLFESTRAKGTDTLSFLSITVPGAVRGQHFHRRKIERFVVVDGEAEIKLRQMVTGKTVTFAVSGTRPEAVDMPPLWAHSLRNTGDRPLITAFWSNELLNPADPDTYRYPVYAEEPKAP